MLFATVFSAGHVYVGTFAPPAIALLATVHSAGQIYLGTTGTRGVAVVVIVPSGFLVPLVVMSGHVYFGVGIG